MDKKQIAKELERLTEFKIIKVDGTKKERLVFLNDTFKIFGEMDKGILNPYNDYTYNWLHSFLSNVKDLISHNDYDDFDALQEGIQEVMHEWVDSEVSVYDGELNNWYATSNDNKEYLEQVVEEGHKTNLMTIAQYKAIDELFNNALNCLIKYLEDNFELLEVV